MSAEASSAASPRESAAPAAPRQPPGLYFLFLTETWERFSFYGMQALLIFYLTQHFLLSDRQAYGVFGSYVALVYTSPILGGWIADRWLGLRKAILLGGIMLAVGHFGMAYEGRAATRVMLHGQAIVQRDETALQTMYLSLTLIALGTGFLKPNISAALGRLYEEHDPRRDRGFTLFFLGINLGGTLSALVVGYLGQSIGWSYGFGAAGVGMLIGLGVFLSGQRHLEGKAEPPDPVRLARRVAGPLRLESCVYVGVLVAVGVAWRLLQSDAGMAAVMGAITIGIGLWLAWFLARRTSPVERDRTIAALILMATAVVFAVGVLQAGTTSALFLQRNVDRRLFGVELQPSQFGVFSGAFVMLLAPVFNALWLRLGRRGREPGAATKMGLGMLVDAASFAVLALSGVLAPSATAVAAGWIVLAIALDSAAELLVYPTGMSMVSKLSAPAVVGLMMGVWFLVSAVAALISARVANFAAIDPMMSPQAAAPVALHLYTILFAGIAAALGVVGVILLLARGGIRRLTHGID